ncbi:cupredoxin domain-containing protein [Actinocrinis puniceicyclus]|uniref:Cupredoxin domain-containing protein n=1 Tax=Actinocrinis puniceicyclus TaxID=977794 RepID=A0A8J7WJ71_9ACTN|nr:cupredoxin domain-containing protein [Actinocrinis puniceicyclus]MBS2962298.1 cupredoxin domain-containing protein [Actinocrinis puniceicyclus]
MNRSSRILGAAATVLALAGAAACSSSSGSGGAAASTPSAAASSSMSGMPAGGGSAPASAADTITIADFAFSGPLTAAPGAQVTVTNKDSVMHTVTADSAGGFDASVPAGGTVTFTAPTAPGSYAYHCAIHPSMKHGTLIVK